MDFAVTSAVRALCLFLLGVLCGNEALAEPPRVFQTGYVFPGFSVADATGQTQVAAAEVRVEGELVAGASATVVFQDCPLSCNAFGDLMPEGEVRESRHPATLAPIEVVDREGWGRRLFAIRFADGRFANRYYLALSGHPALAPRLLLNSDPARPIEPASVGDEQEFYRVGSMSWVLPLTGGRQEPADFDEPLPAIALSSHAFPAERLRGYRTVHVDVNGIAGGEGHLILDGNSMAFDAFGEMLGGTLVAYSPRYVRYEEQPRPDPRGLDRKVHRLVPREPVIQDELQFTLVTAPTALGPHRLIIRRNEELLYVVPVEDRDHVRRLRLLQTLVDDRERSAVVRLHKAFRANAHLIAEKGHVTRVSFLAASADLHALDVLADLTHLTALAVTQAEPFTTERLAVLPRLKGLEQLWLDGAPVEQQVLDQLAELPQLRTLTLKGHEWSETPPPRIKIDRRGLQAIASVRTLETLGFTAIDLAPEDLPILANLSALKSLRLQETPAPLKALLKLTHNLPQLEFDTGSIMVSQPSRTARLMGIGITDDELAEVAGLPWIESLQLETCENITDASFSRVVSLANLSELRVSSAKLITDQGLLGLAKLTKLRSLSLRNCTALTDRTADELIGLTELEELDLSNTGVTPQGLELLRQELPKCKQAE